MHCHTEFHNEEGMSLVLKVGKGSDMAPPPSHMTKCGDAYRKGEAVATTTNSSLKLQVTNKTASLGELV